MKKIRRASQQPMDSNFVYVPPHQRFTSLKISQITPEANPPQQESHHHRTRSYETDLSKKQNTFGLQKSQESNTNLEQRSTQKQLGYLSPKFKIGSDVKNMQINEYLFDKRAIVQQPPPKQKDSKYSIEIQDDGMHSVDSVSERIETLQNRLQQKESQIQELQSQMTSLIQSQQSELSSLRSEKSRIVEQQTKQIAIYCQELKESREDLQLARKDLMRQRQGGSNTNSKTNKENKPNNIFIVDHRMENQRLNQQVDQLKLQVHHLSQQIDERHNNNNNNNNSPLNRSNNANQISMIETYKYSIQHYIIFRQTDTSLFERTFKNLADELNLTIDPNSYDEVLEGVKTLKNVNKEQQKFIKCLKDLVQSCAPRINFDDSEPTLKDMWKFIKSVLSGYLDGRKTLKFNQDTILQICKYLVCVPADICKKTASLVIDNEVLGRIADKVVQIFKLPHTNNLRELDRQLEFALPK